MQLDKNTKTSHERQLSGPIFGGVEIFNPLDKSGTHIRAFTEAPSATFKIQACTTYLRPLRVEIPGSGGILQCLLELSHFKMGGGSIREKYMIRRIKLQRVRVEGHRFGVITTLTGCIGLANFIEE